MGSLSRCETFFQEFLRILEDTSKESLRLLLMLVGIRPVLHELHLDFAGCTPGYGIETMTVLSFAIAILEIVHVYGGKFIFAVPKICAMPNV